MNNTELLGTTYNVFIGRKFNELSDWLLGKNVLRDLYCFQEFPEDKIPEIKRLFKSKEYDFVFAPGWKWKGDIYVELTVFNTRKLRLVQSIVIPLGGKGDIGLLFVREGLRFHMKFGKSSINRSALSTTFLFHNKEFTVVNTHLTANHFNYRRIRQMRMILHSVKNKKSCLVLGDFNYPIGRYLPTLMRGHGFTNVIDRVKTFRFCRGVYWQLDYIFQKGCRVKDIEIKNVYYSDHYPLFFNLSI